MSGDHTPDEVRCARCGGTAKGYATIDRERYCHGDSNQPTCYMRESWDRSGATALLDTLRAEP